VGVAVADTFRATTTTPSPTLLHKGEEHTEFVAMLCINFTGARFRARSVYVD